MKLRHLLVGLIAAVSFTTVAPAMVSAQAPACKITAASVSGATATFTVGSAECTGTVGPISFSTYALPDGKVKPYNKQVAIAHHPSNGSSYGPGTYTLTLTLNGAECWQSDLYYGNTVVTPPHPHTIAVDYKQGSCSTTTTTTAVTTTTVATDTPPVPTTTVDTGIDTPTPTTGPPIPCITDENGHSNFQGTNIPCQGPPPATPVTPTPTTGLPATGSSSWVLVFIAALLVILGIALIQLRKSQ